VSVPTYDRAALLAAPPRILHLGLGTFHRAHQALYFDELLARGALDGGLFEINLVPDRLPLDAILQEQDYLYSALTRGADGSAALTICGAICGYLNAATGRSGAADGSGLAEALERLAADGTALITATITEKGYYYDTARNAPDWAVDAVCHDLAHPEAPQSAAAIIARSLALRAERGGMPVTILSCDNFPENGRVLENCVAAFLKALYPAALPWVEANVAFPCSMVDRITPATDGSLVSLLRDEYGIEDQWPVGSEDYRQWVIEDKFAPRHDTGFNIHSLARVGVEIVPDVRDWELTKIRLLNGSHSALAYLSYLLGYRGVAEAIGDADVGRFIRKHYMEEISATLPAIPGLDLAAYKDTLIRRFGNPAIADTILRLAEDGSKKIPNAILAPLAETAAKGLPNRAIVFALAAWARFLRGADEAGESIPIVDPRGKELEEAATEAAASVQKGGDGGAFLRAIGLDENVMGRRLAKQTLAQSFAEDLGGMERDGVRGALQGHL
jgi:mannitol 2-dehydrogenase